MHDTLPLLENSTFPAIVRNNLDVLQVNLGYLCNLSCTHCHVNAGPNRTELMDRETIGFILYFIDKNNIGTLDLTGGAPEMNPHFKYLVSAAADRGVKVIDRCNLTILMEPDYHEMADFLAQQKVEIVASLPCYMEDNVDKQRGKGTFSASIEALKKLNRLGYGQQNSNLSLNLVFNPQDASLPPDQKALELSYKQHLKEQFGIVFNQLFAMTNLPIQRFGSTLISKGTFDYYLQLLHDNFRAENLDQVMCKNTLSIDWQGYLYDCDFNQMLDLPLGEAQRKIHLTELTDQADKGQRIKTLQHCYGCTAGQGSSCGGVLEG
jgi:radical SAM/Cys-rich protein